MLRTLTSLKTGEVMFSGMVVVPSLVAGILRFRRHEHIQIPYKYVLSVTINNVRREIVSVLTIVSYDKVRGRNKAQR